MRIFCYKCKKELTNEEFFYEVVLTDYQGETFDRNVCSEECGRKVLESNADLHYKRYKECIDRKPRKCNK